MKKASSWRMPSSRFKTVCCYPLRTTVDQIENTSGGSLVNILVLIIESTRSPTSAETLEPPFVCKLINWYSTPADFTSISKVSNLMSLIVVSETLTTIPYTCLCHRFATINIATITIASIMKSLRLFFIDTSLNKDTLPVVQRFLWPLYR